MLVHENLNELPEFKNAVITIGTFDGVHSGHRQIINQLKHEAAEVNGESVIISFFPHPRMVLNSEAPSIKLLNTVDEKIHLLEKLEIDHLVVVPFTSEFAEQSAEEYVRNFLINTFHPSAIIIGYDHRFGKDRKGDYKLLERYAAEYHYEVKEIPKHILNQVGISSTRIREAIKSHNVKTANEYLGYSYFFSGKVVHGEKLGRTLGYPTANIEVDDLNKLIPSHGIYAVEAQIKRQYSLEPSIYKGMMSIGTRPTVGGKTEVIEVNLFDFNSDIYDADIKITMIDFLREEKTFEGLEELKEAMAKDKEACLKIFAYDH